MSALSELETKLSAYEAGLAQVEEALRGDSNNNDLISARNELADVIKLTKELINVWYNMSICNSYF